MIRSVGRACLAVVLLVGPGASPALAVATDPEVWTGTQLAQPATMPDADALVVGVTAGPDVIVAVGQRACRIQPPDGERSRCWGQAWTSPDGVEWTTVDPRTSGLDLGVSLPVLSGPDVGLGGVAYGPGGFIAFGRAGDGPKGRQSTAVWQSDDGGSWERVTERGDFPSGTRLRTILGAEDGYLLGGVIYTRRMPRAAIWSSPDGRTWTLARGRDTFDIGGYIDTMEDPASGGVNAFSLYPAASDGPATLAGGAVAVGQACMGPANRSIFAWQAYCWGAVWRSEDGASWQRDEGGPQTRGAASVVAAVGDRLVADAPICFSECPSAILVSDDATAWQVAYGSPVGGPLESIVAAEGRYYSLVSEYDPAGASNTLAVWVSDDGSGWRLADAQPTADAMAFHHVAMTVAGDRLVVVASGEAPPDGDFRSIALLSPPVASMG